MIWNSRSAVLVDGQVAEFVDDEEGGGLEIAGQFALEAAWAAAKVLTMSTAAVKAIPQAGARAGGRRFRFMFAPRRRRFAVSAATAAILWSR